MSKSKKRIIEQAAEDLGWSTEFRSQRRTISNGGKWDKEKTEFYVEFEQSSPAGEDVILTEFYDRLDDIPKKLFERYEDFDVNDHVKMWLEAKENKVRGVPDAKELVEDGEWQEQAILELAEALRDALAGRKPEKKAAPKDKLQELFDLIDRRDRSQRGVYEAWDTINGLVNEVYGIDIGDALCLWEEQKGA